MSMLSDGGGRNDSGVPISGDATSFPCTPLQRRFFEIQQARPNATVGNVAMRWRVKGPLRDAAIEFALQALIDRHEILSTRFVLREGVPVQVVEAVRIRPSIIDISRLPGHLAEDEIARISRITAKVVFDLGIAPLLRCNVIRISATEAILLLTFHSTIIDGWSVGIIAREFASFVAAHVSGAATSLPEIHLQYADYALWQKEALAASTMAQSRRFWLQALDGVSFFEVPHPDRSRPAVQSGEGAIRTVLLDEPLTGNLRQYAALAGQTMFVLGGASLTAALGRIAGTTDVVLTTQLAGRGESLLHTTVGPVLNSVVLRIDTEMADDVPRYLQRWRATFAEAFAHGELPFEDAIAAAGLNDLPGHSYALGVNYTAQAANVDTGGPGSIKAGDIEMVSMPSVSVGALVDLNFFMVEREFEGWRISCEFNADIYDAEQVDEILKNWRAELDRVAHAPTLPSHVVVESGLDSRPATPVVIREPSRNYFRVVPLQAQGSLPPIFAFNNRSAYYPIARYFGETRPFIDIQWLEEATLPPLSAGSISELAADAARRVLEFDPIGPYYFMGHCMMGNVAFETARQIQDLGHKVLSIFLLDTLAPGYVENMPKYDQILRRISLLGHSLYYFKKLAGALKSGELDLKNAILHYTFIRNSSIYKWISRRTDGYPDNYGNDIMNNGLMNYLRDAKALYKCEINAMDAVFFRSADAMTGRLFARDFGWRQLIGGDLRVYDVPGAHLAMTREPGAGVIAEHIAWVTDRLEGRWHIASYDASNSDRL